MQMNWKIQILSFSKTKFNIALKRSGGKDENLYEINGRCRVFYICERTINVNGFDFLDGTNLQVNLTKRSNNSKYSIANKPYEYQHFLKKYRKFVTGSKKYWLSLLRGAGSLIFLYYVNHNLVSPWTDFYLGWVDKPKKKEIYSSFFFVISNENNENSVAC